MLKSIQHLHPIIFILIATIFEVSGDAIVRTAIYNHSGLMRIGFMGLGAILLFIYGFSLNLAPVEFGEVVGLYIATLFIVWQVVNFIAFQTIPTLPIILGGSLVIAGGMIITFWKY
jgi:small multidrug resistance family-3 protein